MTLEEARDLTQIIQRLIIMDICFEPKTIHNLRTTGTVLTPFKELRNEEQK